ncbi:MAG: hypothetical protein KGV56_00160 [Gammaproteobacteria bacterium]|nr:hypothetical protein [Gammaproteobacteria bacterium]
MSVNINHLKRQDDRRMVVWFLSYDRDNQLSEVMLHTCFEAHGKDIDEDELSDAIQWLYQKGLVTIQRIEGVDFILLTNDGLKVAKGRINIKGVRNLRNSERAEIKAFHQRNG